MRKTVAAVVAAGFQNFFTSGGVGPFTWTVSAGQLPPGAGAEHPDRARGPVLITAKTAAHASRKGP